MITWFAISYEAILVDKTLVTDAVESLKLGDEAHYPTLFTITKDLLSSQAEQLFPFPFISPINSQEATHTWEEEILFLQTLHCL